VHPATRLLILLLLLVASQGLTGGTLWAAMLPFLLSGYRTLSRSWQLIRRTRWLLLSLLLIFTWGSVGEPLWTGPLAPTREGLHEALDHLGHLLLALASVAALLTSTSAAEMINGARHMLKPLRYAGIDADRALIRLLLVLHYLEVSPRPQDWRQLLATPSRATVDFFDLNDTRLAGSDYLALLLVSMAVALFYLL